MSLGHKSGEHEDLIGWLIVSAIVLLAIGVPVLAYRSTLEPANSQTDYQSTSIDYTNWKYDPNSKYAPSYRTNREIDQLVGSKAEKDSLRRAVQQLNENTARRGERPIDW